MKVFNIRYGLATNSSSVHSFIFMENMPADELVEEAEFGWENFTAASDKSKRSYLASAIYSNVSPLVGIDIAILVAKSWSGVDLDPNIGYIDHQSRPSFPREWDGKGINTRFLEEYKKYLLQDNLVVIGGNDNLNDESEDHSLRRTGRSFVLPLFYDRNSEVVARYDEQYKYWTLFDRCYGTKVSFSFDDIHAERPSRSTYPELIDIKITDYCPYGCKYCYQDSKPSGAHADNSNISSLFYNLAEFEVFEVAIGGGEPTLHPDFVSILRSARSYGIVPNFTTRNLKWLYESDREEIIKNCGAFAYSVDDSNNIRKLGAILDTFNIPRSKARIQYVLGTSSGSTDYNRYKFQRVLVESFKNGFSVTLLSFKSVGRGNPYKKSDYVWWIDVAKEVCDEYYGNLGVDTGLINEFREEIIAAGVPDLLFRDTEGRFSCYVDLVNKKIAPSSYCDDSEFVDFPTGEFRNLEKIYKEFSK